MVKLKWKQLKRGLAFKMIFLIFLSIAAVMLLIFWYNYTVTKKIVVNNLQKEAERITENAILKIDEVLSNIQAIPRNYSFLILSELGNEEKMKYFLREMVETNKDVFGAALAFEPKYRSPGELYYSFYYYRNSGEVKFKYLGGSQYDYFTMDWYQIPRELGKAGWSEPYIDVGGGNILMSTFSVPLYIGEKGKRKFIGILTVDVSLDHLQQIVNSIKVYETGYGYMISRTGTVVTHKNPIEIMNESIFSLADDKHLPELREIGRKMISQKSGFSDLPYKSMVNNKKCKLYYAPVPASGWSVAIVIPVDEFMADANKLYGKLIELIIFGLVVIFIVILLISRSITGSLRRLTVATEKFAEGDFNVALPPIKSKDEIGRLNNAFIYMQETLARTIHDLQQTTDELKISHEKLEEYSRTLEQKVDERTSELTAKNQELDAAFNRLKAAQAQLVQSEKMASLGQLTAGIAHEIKNPLNFINNFSELSVELVGEMLQETDKLTSCLGEKEAGYVRGILQDIEGNVRKINEHGKRADSIIRGMLLHSRGKSGERMPTDLNALLAEYVNLGYHGMRATDSSFNIKIESDYDQNLQPVNVIPQDLARVFLNTINNACYSTHQKKKEFRDAYFPILKVSTRDLGDKVEIRIWDNGKGIPKAVLEKIFNPFFTTKPAGSGTGLGLSISFDIVVQEHRGQITVDSKEGEYAEFVITIPKSV
jgi:signal transduction histidine kinase